MIDRLIAWRRDRKDRADHAVRGVESVMRAARRPELYTAGWAEDTREGRFAMACVFGALAIRRLRLAGPEGARRADLLMDSLFDRFDYALREEGVGDASIARKVRALGEEFVGLGVALGAALDAEDASSAVDEALRRNGLGGEAPQAFSTLILATDVRLRAQSAEQVLSGDFDWERFPSAS